MSLCLPTCIITPEILIVITFVTVIHRHFSCYGRNLYAKRDLAKIFNLIQKHSVETF